MSNDDELKYSSVRGCRKKDICIRLTQTIDIAEKCTFDRTHPMYVLGQEKELMFEH